MANIIRFNKQRYLKASKKEKTEIINNIVGATGMTRKSVIRALMREIYRSPRVKKRPGRPRKYSPMARLALRDIWEAYGYICGERLYGQIPEAIRIMHRDNQWKYDQDTTDLVLQMSLSTVKRLTTELAKKKGLCRGISATNSDGAVKSMVPVFRGNYALQGLGYGEIDTVVHSGVKLQGQMAYSVMYVDMETYWIEPYAQYGKSANATLHSIHKIAQRLPWPIRGIHADSGSEFINEVLVNYCKKRSIELTRSRPSKKNDNCHVEERNCHVIRKYLGYNRYDHPDVVKVMNELYYYVRLYVNYFQPAMRVSHIEEYSLTVDDNGIEHRKRRKRYKTKTPYAMVLENPNIAEGVKDKLRMEYETLNPIHIRDMIKALQRKLSKLQKELGYHFDVNLEQD